ncbi:hypothetical protein G7007_20745 [Pseudomonas entomophila]|uniref:DUF6173 family protein n=1 Tax=Pseudomonas entomophila TaxID=312306 RepID=UPI0015E417F0|nr:DUF6173 family protein [Pseudomonas entomophila]MBA1195255.1 hypothetical protein [Pseudomonas entomophila]
MTSPYDLIREYNRPPIMDVADHNHASEFYWRLVQWINDFHRELEDEYEVGGQLVNFGSEITFSFTDLTYWNPSLIGFYGTKSDGSPVKLIQHVSQINVLLVRQKRAQPEEPKRPIGFASWEEYEKEVADKG